MTLRQVLIGMTTAAFFAAAFALGAQKQQDVERQLKAAINTEMVDRDLKGAIEQYKKVVASGNRPLVAQALLHMADCYRKLGDAQANKVYEQITREYADQRDVAAQAQAYLGVGGSDRVVYTPKGLTKVTSSQTWHAVT